MGIYKGNNLIAGPVLNTDLTPDPIPTEGSPRHVMSGGVYNALLTKEDAANKTTVVDANSTDDQYPSAKAVYDALGTREPANIEYARDLYTPDWSKAGTIPSSVLLLGFTAPARGIIIGSTMPKDVGGGVIALNGIVIGYTFKNTAVQFQAINIMLSVVAGDIIRSNVSMTLEANFNLFFVPYKAQ